LFKCNRDTLHNTFAGGVKEVPLCTAAGNGFLQTNLSRTNGRRRRNSTLNGTDSNLLFKCNRDTLHNTFAGGVKEVPLCTAGAKAVSSDLFLVF